jgi:hypothetical protein
MIADLRVLLIVAALGLTAMLAACGSAAEPEPAQPAQDGFYEPPEPEPGFDPLDPALNLLPETNEAEQALIQRLGRRRDFRIPRGEVAGLAEGPLARAVIARMWHELEIPHGDDRRYRRLNEGQRALYALQWADAEILNGGFEQFWSNDTGYFAADLQAAARRVGSREFEALFRDAAALFPAGRIPRDQDERARRLARIDGGAIAQLDERYFAFQYRRSTALGLILGRYVKAHPDEFLV